MGWTPGDDHLLQDRELAEILEGDAELLELSRRLREARPEPVLAPHFQGYLRARLLDAAALELRPRGLARWWQPRGTLLALGGGLGVAMIAAALTITVLDRGHDEQRLITASAQITNRHDVDPHGVITIDFSQDVDHGSVVRAIRIQPAAQYDTSWSGTTLTIKPRTQLVPNTPYTVTIPKDAIRSTGGSAAAVTADIRIPFGTAPTPAPAASGTGSTPPPLVFTRYAAVSGGTHLALTPDGSVLAAGSGVAPSPPAGASPSPGGTLSAAPSGGGVATSPSASAVDASPSLYRYSVDAQSGQVQGLRVADSAGAVAFSPSGQYLAYVEPQAPGGAALMVALADGSGSRALVAGSVDPASPLAWRSETVLVYLGTDGRLHTLDQTTGRVTSVSLPAGVTLVELSPQGRYAVLAPLPAAAASPSASAAASASASAPPSGSAAASPSAAATGAPAMELMALDTLATRTLDDTLWTPSFARSDGTVAWLDLSGDLPRLETSHSDGSGAATDVPIPDLIGGDTVGRPEISPDGHWIAYSLTTPAGDTTLRVASLPDGAVHATADGGGMSTVVWNAASSRIAVVRAIDGTAVAETADIVGLGGGSTVPAEVTSLLDRFLRVQVGRGSTGDLGALAPSLPGASVMPGGVNAGDTLRYYVLQIAPGPNQTWVASVRIARDPTSARPAGIVDETVTIAPSGAGFGASFIVTRVAPSVPQIRDAPLGPQVLHVDSQRLPLGDLVIDVAFDSDLDPASVSASTIQVTTTDGRTLAATVDYSPDQRTATVHVLGAALVPGVRLTVSTGLQDVQHQALASAYMAVVGS